MGFIHFLWFNSFSPGYFAQYPQVKYSSTASEQDIIFLGGGVHFRKVYAVVQTVILKWMSVADLTGHD